MKTAILISSLLLALIFSSCHPQKSIETITLDSIVYKYDTVLVIIPSDSALITATIQCDSLKNADLEIFKSKRIVVSGAVKKSRLRLAVKCREDSLFKVIEGLDRERLKLIKTKEIVEVENPLNTKILGFACVVTVMLIGLFFVKVK